MLVMQRLFEFPGASRKDSRIPVRFLLRRFLEFLKGTQWMRWIPPQWLPMKGVMKS